jgi:hypothetical protein
LRPVAAWRPVDPIRPVEPLSPVDPYRPVNRMLQPEYDPEPYTFVILFTKDNSSRHLRWMMPFV